MALMQDADILGELSIPGGRRAADTLPTHFDSSHHLSQKRSLPSCSILLNTAFNSALTMENIKEMVAATIDGEDIAFSGRQPGRITEIHLSTLLATQHNLHPRFLRRDTTLTQLNLYGARVPP